MLKLRFRLKTLMIIVAFAALILTVVIQSVLLRKAMLIAELSRAEAEQARDVALMREARARAALEQARELAKQFARDSKQKP
jgi:hypothetical protein